MIKRIEDSTILQNYVSGIIKLTPIMNILINDYDTNWYSKLGHYFLDKMGVEYFREDHLMALEKLNGSKKEKEVASRMLGIYFITSYLNKDTLKKMFNTPIKHSHFGEGFDTPRKYSYCSYFINIDDVIFHIGYDHRGTTIECQILDAKGLYTSLCKLIDLYNEHNS